MATRIRFNAQVHDIKERFSTNWIRNCGNDAEFEKVSIGWYLCLGGSYEALYVGNEKPDFKEGDLVRVIIERVDLNALRQS